MAKKKQGSGAEGARRAQRGRPKILEMPTSAFSSRLRDDYAERLTEMTRVSGKPKTRLLEEAVEMYLDHWERLVRLGVKTGRSPRRVLADALRRFEEEVG